MSFTEITGLPCSGKSTLINKSILNNEIIFSKNRNLYKILYFFLGINFLKFKRVKVLLYWSMKEDAPFYFKINIFLNAVSKFGVFQYLKKNNNKLYDFLIDEGISHLPFLFLKTNTEEVINFFLGELKILDVNYLSSPGDEAILNRLLERGHKRLKFLNTGSFILRTQEIEIIILSIYL